MDWTPCDKEVTGLQWTPCDKEVTRWTVRKRPTSVVGWACVGDDVLCV
jgi:hypothetical protein